MSWKAGLSKNLTVLRFFACPVSSSSLGVMNWVARNIQEIRELNPTMFVAVRTVENCMPAVTTDLNFTTEDLIRFMLQTGRFRDPNGTISESRIEAAKAYLSYDWEKFEAARHKLPGFDPESPLLHKEDPKGEWREKKEVKQTLGPWIGMQGHLKETIDTLMSGPNDEWEKSKNALLMCQRVDLWCAGPSEVEKAVIHLYNLGRFFNTHKFDFPDYVADYLPDEEDLYTFNDSSFIGSATYAPPETIPRLALERQIKAYLDDAIMTKASQE